MEPRELEHRNFGIASYLSSSLFHFPVSSLHYINDPSPTLTMLPKAYTCLSLRLFHKNDSSSSSVCHVSSNASFKRQNTKT